MEIEPSAIDGAKSAVIYSLVARENTMERAALQSFVNQVLKQVPASYNRTLLSAIQVKVNSQNYARNVLNSFVGYDAR